MNPQRFGRVGVLAGGFSNERDISLESGMAVFTALKTSGCDVAFIDIREPLTKRHVADLGIDCAFIALHGRFGEDGTVQGILEAMDIPYTGSGPAASRRALDKVASREIFIRHGLTVPRYNIFKKGMSVQVGRFPVVVKPRFEGSSIGVSIAGNAKGLAKAVDAAFCYDDEVIVEDYIRGRELTVGILADEPLPVIEIVADEEFFDFTAKYKSDSTRYIVPAKISKASYRQAQRIGKSAHAILGCRSFSRVDMMLDEQAHRIVVLELNSIPGLTSHSLLPKAAAVAGVGFDRMCLTILKSALDRKKAGTIG